jgi:hypothetical protein
MARTELSLAIGRIQKAKTSLPKAKAEIDAMCHVDNTIAQPKRKVGLSA